MDDPTRDGKEPLFLEGLVFLEGVQVKRTGEYEHLKVGNPRHHVAPKSHMCYHLGMEWDAEFYETASGQCPVTEFLESLTDKHRAKVLRGMQLVQEFGPELGMPYVEMIHNGIQCLRIKHGSDIFRVFFFVGTARTIVFLHGFRKKTQKTPASAIAQAMRYRRDFLDRKGEA